MAAERFKIEGFDSPETVASKTGFNSAHDEKVTSDGLRRANDKLVDSRFVLLKEHIEDLHHKFAGLSDRVGVVDTQTVQIGTAVQNMRTEMATNTELTKQILNIIGSGKIIVAIIKFCGVMTVPVTAILALVQLIHHGGFK